MGPIFQIYITSDNSDLPHALRTKTLSIKSRPDVENYNLFNGIELRSFIDAHFDRDVVNAYDQLKPYAYKADLGRYCLLYHFGGWYFDIAIELMRSITLPQDSKGLLFRDINLLLPYGWGISNGLLFTTKGNAIMRAAIDRIVSHCQQKFYGETPFSVTGPGMLGQILAINGDTNGMIYGDRLPLTPLHPIKNVAYVLPRGEIIAHAKQTGHGGDLTPYGSTGTNNYMTLWAARDIYE